MRRNSLPVDPADLKQTIGVYQSASAHIMGRRLRGHGRSLPTADHPFTGIMNAAPKVVFSRTLRSAEWANTTIAMAWAVIGARMCSLVAGCECGLAGRADCESMPGMLEHDVTVALNEWGARHRDNPYALFAAVRQRGAVHPVTLADGHDAWLVVHHDEARAALNVSSLSKDMHAALAENAAVVSEGLPGPAFARHMLTVDPPDHTRLRRLVSSAFTPRRIERLQPRIQAIVDDLLDDIATDGADSRVDLVSRVAFPLPFTVICELLGVPEADRAALGAGLTGLLVPTSTPEQYAEAKRSSDIVVGLLEKLVEDKSREPGDDLVSALIAARDGAERLDTRELRSTIFQLIVAGHDTTASFIGNSIVALFRNPDQLAALRRDPGKLETALEEFLRFDAPVPHSTFRYTVEPVELGGVTIPAGAQVIISLAAANHDEHIFEHPEVLDIDRTGVRHIAFGHGIHHCLGAPLARLEGRLALGTLLRRFPQMRLAVTDDELRWGHGDGLVLRGLSELPVIPGPALPRQV